MKHFIAIILAGLLGTTCMTSVMSVIHRSGFANADMVRAIGSMVTRTYENSLMPGILIHFTSGFIFAFIYSTGMGILLPVESIIAAAIRGCSWESFMVLWSVWY